MDRENFYVKDEDDEKLLNFREMKEKQFRKNMVNFFNELDYGQRK